MNKTINKVLISALISAATLAGTTVLATSTVATSTKTESPKMASPYQTYSPEAFEAAKAEQRVLFFHATWCPNCKQADADITANLAKLPAGIVIFKTDYDKEIALKKKYSITSQHTFVLVDADGKALKKWAGGGLKQIMAKTTTVGH